MALSDHEQALLAQMEEALLVDDPELVSTLTGNRLYPGRTRILLGVGLALSGLAILFIGLIAQIIVVGILGFLISLIGATMSITAASGWSSLRPHRQSKSKRTSLNSRMEERWDQRNFDK